MKSVTKKYFFALLFLLLVVCGVGYYHVKQEKDHVDHIINTTLLDTAEIAYYVIGNNFHDQILKTPPSKIEDMQTIKTLSLLAKDQNVEYIYSLILDKKGQLRFTSSSATEAELVTQDKLSHYFDIYPSNANMIKALKTNQIIFDTNEVADEWGSFRSVFVPHTTPSGIHYIIGVDIKIGTIQKLSNIAILNSLFVTFILFFGLIPLMLVYRSSKKETEKFLREEVLAATTNLRKLNERLKFKVEKKTEKLLSQNITDSLTGLPNRTHLESQLEQKKFSSLAILNLHNFQEINDFFGTAIGDDLLKQIGVWLQTLYGGNLYRLGGDEFVIVIEEERSRKEMARIYHEFIHNLANKTFYVNGEHVTLDVTIGIDDSLIISLAHADIALHQAKENGNHFEFYSEVKATEKQYLFNISMTKMVREALNREGIICYYQPIVSTKSGKIEKYETLVRMIDSNGLIIPPIDFLKIAQKTRLYPQITRTVIQHACTAFRERSEEFSVNLSIRDILDPDTVQFIEKTILETGTAQRIVFEILESEGIEDFESAILFIQKMKKLGAKIAIDDYGTGYSSIENILKLDIDYIKIDGSLIHSIISNPKHAILVESIADFSSKLGVKTIAEYVSSEEIFTKIKSIGVTYSQGYYTGKPAPLPDL
ncbi:MAG: EAL domain-containing protein [Campylobacterales bacterium]|nr:EAL domain-containing protein [Campylobacterales bacterium]